MGKQSLINPHQRCGYSDSPFARIHYFYTAGSRKGVGDWRRQTGSKSRSGSAGIDNEAIWSVKEYLHMTLFKMGQFGSQKDGGTWCGVGKYINLSGVGRQSNNELGC